MLKGLAIDFVCANRSAGKREVFLWDDYGLGQYLNWAFSNDYLFCVSGENGISGLGVAYPLSKPFDWELSSLLPSDEQVLVEDTSDLVVMDWIAINPEARVKLVEQFKSRFWNWKNQRKFGVHYGKPKELSNNYINKLSKLQWEPEQN